MRVRFGYVALAKAIQNPSPNKTVTATALERLPDDVRFIKLRHLTRDNLQTLLRICKYNRAYDVHVFRLTSRLVPLITHPLAEGFDYSHELANEFKEVADYIALHPFRASFHPDHFVNLNSPKAEIRESSIAILKHHLIQSHALGLGDETKFNIHIGGAYKDKKSSTARFITTFRDLPEALQKRIIVENDDKTFTARDTLAVCQALLIPMTLDIHHHAVHHEEDATLSAVWSDVVATWKTTGLPPKIHASSPRTRDSNNKTELRSHADFVNPNDVLPFLRMASQYTETLDVMIEAKEKDLALFRIVENLAQETGIQRVDGTTLDIQ